MKKLTGIIVLLIVLLLGACALADSSGKCGDNLTWTLTDDGALTISGTGRMDNYLSHNCPWGKNVKKATVEAGVTGIGNDAFYACEAMTEITLPDGLESIGDYAFYRCKALKEITIPDGVTWVGDHAFHECSAVRYAAIGSYGAKKLGERDYSFRIPGNPCDLRYTMIDGKVSNLYVVSVSKDAAKVEIPAGVTWISKYSFADSPMTEVTIPDTVTYIGETAFLRCKGLTRVTIPDSVKGIGGSAFAECEALVSIRLPDGIEVLPDQLVAYCTNLKEVTIPSSVKTIERAAFARCENLTEVIVPDSVTRIDDAVFGDCLKLKSVTLPAGLARISDYLFYDCGSLTSVNIPETVTEIARCAFENCSALEKLVIPDRVTTFGEDAFKGAEQVVLYCGKGSPADAYAQEHGLKVSYTGSYLPPETGGDLEAGETKAIESSFDYGSESWEGLSARSSNEKVAKVKSMGLNGIVNNTQLFTITIEGVSPGCATITLWGGDTVKLWSRTVIVSGKLQTYTVTVSVTPKNAGTAAADPASGIEGTEVTLAAEAKDGFLFKEWKVVSGGVEVADNRFVIGTANVEIQAVFEAKIVDQVTQNGIVYQLNHRKKTAAVVKPAKASITKATIPATVKANSTTYKVTEIKAKAFKGKTKLATVKIGKNVKTIGANAFYGCTKLKTVSGMAAVTAIGDGAFGKCKALGTFTIPAKVAKIGAKAFQSCSGMKTLTIKTTKLTAQNVGANAFDTKNKKTVYKVPAKKLKAYREWMVKKGVKNKDQVK